MDANGFQVCDLHTHTIFSDGRLAPEEVAEMAQGLGYRVGIADHCGRGSFQLEDNRRFDRYLEALRGLPVFASVELDLGNPGSVTPDRLARCDYLIGGLHSMVRAGGRLDFFDPEADPGDPAACIGMMLDEIGKGAREHRFHILAHPGLLPAGLRQRADSLLDVRWEEGLIGLALEHGFALEISSRWELSGRRLIEKARRAGVRFSLGSDGHSRERMCRLDYSLAVMRDCGMGTGELYQPPVPEGRAPALIPTTGPTVSAH